MHPERVNTNDLKFNQRFRYGTFQVLDHFIGRARVNKMIGKRRYALQQSILKTLQAKGPAKLKPVERRKDLSLRDFIREYVKTGIPVVLEGAAKEWVCTKKWSLDYFRQLHGDDEIVMVDQSQIANGYEKTTLRDVIDNISGGGKKYYRFYPLLERHPEHILDFDYKWLRERRYGYSMAESFQVFIGGKNTETPIHNASAPNLFVQAYGEKKWVLYTNYHTPVIDPAPVRNIYRSAPIRSDYYFNPFDAHPDYKTYPCYEFIEGYEVVLQPGDVLWNPPFVWHTIKNLSDSIGVGYRWFAPFYSWKLSPLYATLDLFATKPPIWKSIKLMKMDMNLVHLAETGRLNEYQQSLKK